MRLLIALLSIFGLALAPLAAVQATASHCTAAMADKHHHAGSDSHSHDAMKAGACCLAVAPAVPPTSAIATEPLFEKSAPQIGTVSLFEGIQHPAEDPPPRA